MKDGKPLEDIERWRARGIGRRVPARNIIAELERNISYFGSWIHKGYRNCNKCSNSVELAFSMGIGVVSLFDGTSDNNTPRTFEEFSSMYRGILKRQLSTYTIPTGREQIIKHEHECKIWCATYLQNNAVLQIVLWVLRYDSHER